MDEHNTDIHELSGTSLEFRTQLAKQLEELVPEAIADGKVDIAKLKEPPQEDTGLSTPPPDNFQEGLQHHTQHNKDNSKVRTNVTTWQLQFKYQIDDNAPTRFYHRNDIPENQMNLEQLFPNNMD